jgi:hypothetical protein
VCVGDLPEFGGRVEVVARCLRTTYRRIALRVDPIGRDVQERHVHHDVDEKAVRAEKRSQILPFLLKPSSQRFAGFGQHIHLCLVARHVIPATKRVEKDETQVVNLAISFSMFQQARIVFRLSSPADFTSLLVKEPHHAGEEPAAPIGPRL